MSLERAAAAGDREGEALARVVSARFRLDYEDTVDELDALAREALPLLEQANDHAGLAHVWNAFSEAARPFVRVISRVPEEEVISLYRSHDVLLWTSTYEGFGLVLLEAMGGGFTWGSALVRW